MRHVAGLLTLLLASTSGWVLKTTHSPLLLLVSGVVWMGSFALFGIILRRPWFAGIVVTVVGFSILWALTGHVNLTGWLLPLVTGAIATVTAYLTPVAPQSHRSWVDGIWAVSLFFLASIAVSTTQVHLAGPLGSHLLLLVGVYLLTPVIEVGIIAILVHRMGQRPGFFSTNYPPIKRSHVAIGLITGFGASLLMALIVSAENHIGHVQVRSNNPFVYATGLNFHAVLAMILVGVAVVLVAPITEEMLFRGIVFGSFLKRWPYPVASLGSAVLFGLAHMDVTLLLPLTIAGILLNALYHKTRSLVPSTIAHATLNAVSVLMAVFATR